MPKVPQNSGQHLVPLDVPEWLARAVLPWRIEGAALWRTGVRLDLRSDRASIPVLVELRGQAPLAMSLLDPRIPSAAGAAFVRALGARFRAAAGLPEWLQRLQVLAASLESGTTNSGADPVLTELRAIWRVWPRRESDPRAQVEALPRVQAWSESSSRSRSGSALIVLHQFARAELLDALAAWDALPEAGSSPSFTELHLDAVALGLLGRRGQATEALQRAEQVCVEAEQWLVLARAYEALDQREAAVRAHEQVVATRGGDWDRLRLARSRGDLAPNEAVPHPATGASASEQVSFVRELVKILDAAGRYDDSLTALVELTDRLGPATPIELVVRAAELHLWRVEPALVRARIAAVPGAKRDPMARVVLAAATLLEGHAEQALAQLGEIEAEGATDLMRLLWEAEAALALGRYEAALVAIDRHIVRENSLIAYLLKLLALVHSAPAETLAGSIGSRTFLDALVVDVLPTLLPPAAIEAARTEPGRFIGLIRGLLDDMGGNRGPAATWCRRDAHGTRLERVVVRPTGREAAVANLVRIRTTAPDAVLAGFDAVMDAYPDSPHPCTYRGELLIWLGRYSDALASFDEADARAPTRWSYVGRAAAYDLLGEAELADHWTAAGIEKFGEIETATTHVYRGERRRKLGEWAAARSDLETALVFKTRRIGARINLALVYDAQGEAGLYAEQTARLRVDAPAYCWEAGARGDQPLEPTMLQTMLERMVGNRSSFLHSLIDVDGEFRIIPEPERWIAHARLSLPQARDELGRMLGRLCLAGAS